MPAPRHAASSLPPEGQARLEGIIARFEDEWQQGRRPHIDAFLPAGDDPVGWPLLVELVQIDLERRLKAGEPTRTEEYLSRYPALSADPRPAFELIIAEFDLRCRYADGADLADFCRRFPPHASRLRDWLADRPSGFGSRPSALASTGPDDAPARREPPPARMGRYRILVRLGSGSFGTVYKGYDEELSREVAIKVPHRQLVACAAAAEAYLAEGRILASLDHPGIVPVYDVGRTPDGLCYLVGRLTGQDVDSLIAALEAAREAPRARRISLRVLDAAESR